jgi:methylated-DNA-protein-cysteine methyltransferase-like protein
MSTEPFRIYTRIYLVVEQIPSGCVSSYGDIALIVGGGCEARVVGDALGAIPREWLERVPWQRVVNREGGISTHGLLQRDMLEGEGVPFDPQGRVVLARCRWSGPESNWARTNGFQVLPPRDDAEQLSLF